MNSYENRIRDVKKDDCESLCNLIADLAQFEEMSHLNNMTRDKLMEDGFLTPTPWFSALLAEAKMNESWIPVGYALFQRGFSLR